MRTLWRKMVGWFVMRQSQAARHRQWVQSDRQVWDGLIRGSDDPDTRRGQEQARGWYAQQEQRQHFHRRG